MTRHEFFEDITEWWQLIEFCRDNGYDGYVEDIYDDDGRDEFINECLVDWAREDTWRELLNRLDDIPTGYAYYRYNYGDWDGLDDGDLEALKRDVAAECDADGLWDEEDTDEEDDEDEFADDEDFDEESDDEDDDTPIEDEDCSLDELFFAGISCVKGVEEARRAESDDTEKSFWEMIGKCFG